MKQLLFTLLGCTTALFGTTLNAPLKSVDESTAVIAISQIQRGVSGYIIRHFDKEHSAIIANATVTHFDSQTNEAALKLTPYTSMNQEAMPKGVWQPRVNDEALLAVNYHRAMLIAPDGDIYDDITKKVGSLEWIHPDQFAAHLSNIGHPSPTAEDFAAFCTNYSVGLIYIYNAGALSTLDCQSLAQLQLTNVAYTQNEEVVPFYNRINTIREGWWGEGSSAMEAYGAYYSDLIASHNPTAQKKEN